VTFDAWNDPCDEPTLKSPAHSKQKLARCHELLNISSPEPHCERCEELNSRSLKTCPVCHQGQMIITEFFEAITNCPPTPDCATLRHRSGIRHDLCAHLNPDVAAKLTRPKRRDQHCRALLWPPRDRLGLFADSVSDLPSSDRRHANTSLPASPEASLSPRGGVPTQSP
jgi:hypothetical protein